MLGGMEVIHGLVEAGTIGRMRLGAIRSQRTNPRLCRRGMETQNSLMTMSLMSSWAKEARIQVIITFLFID